jgi:hypothetical protein
MPRFLDVLNSIDWQWWMGEVPTRIDWWPSAQHYWYVYPCRLAVALSACAVLTSAATFAVYCYSKLHGEISIGRS